MKQKKIKWIRLCLKTRTNQRKNNHNEQLDSKKNKIILCQVSRCQNQTRMIMFYLFNRKLDIYALIVVLGLSFDYEIEQMFS